MCVYARWAELNTRSMCTAAQLRREERGPTLRFGCFQSEACIIKQEVPAAPSQHQDVSISVYVQSEPAY